MLMKSLLNLSDQRCVDDFINLVTQQHKNDKKKVQGFDNENLFICGFNGKWS